MKSRRRHKKKRKPACGTPAGYEAHFRNNERPCGLCLPGSETYSDSEIQALIHDFQLQVKDQMLWSTYQLSLERFMEIFAAQGHRCACCSKTDPGKAPWHVDHDHQTGAIRGILCSNCNTGIGQLGDDLEGLQHAVSYLQSYANRGGHVKAEKPPQNNPGPRISLIMRRCFDLFVRGVPRNQVVIIMRLTPDTVDQIHALWTKTDGEINPVDKHFFQIPKDTSQSFMCACGYRVSWSAPDEVDTAIHRVNAHIKEANEDREAEWTLLASEEAKRRHKEEQRQKEERRRAIALELKQSAKDR